MSIGQQAITTEERAMMTEITEPPVMQTIAEEVGFKTAVVLTELWPDRKLYVPDQASPDHPLARDIGMDALERLCAVFGSQSISIPKLESARMARQKRKVRVLVAHGWCRRDIADMLDMTERQVRYLMEGDK